jgi:hypothetical protein
MTTLPTSAKEITKALNGKGFVTSTTTGGNAHSVVSGRKTGITTAKSDKFGVNGNDRVFVYVVTCHGVSVDAVASACKELGYKFIVRGFEVRIMGGVAFTVSK